MPKLSAILHIAIVTTHIYAATETRRCNCYMLGTLEDNNGQSACDSSSGLCSCLPNVDGRDCDKCKAGYFGILSGTGCKFCSCNMIGAVSQDCNSRTGQCQCKVGFEGFKCDTCSNGSSIIGNTCCDCDKDLSETLECNKDVTCTCKPNAVGDKCNKCDTNYYKKDGSCTHCGPCYKFVSDSVNDFKTLLQAINEILDDIVVTEGNVDANLKDKINTYMQRIAELEPTNVETVIHLLDELKTLQTKLDKLPSLPEPTTDITKLSKKFDKLEKLITKAEKLVSSENSPHNSGPLKNISISAQNHAAKIEEYVTQIQNNTTLLLNSADVAKKAVENHIVEVRTNLTHFKEKVTEVELKINLNLKKDAAEVKEESEYQNIRAKELKMKASKQNVPELNTSYDGHGNILHEIKTKVAKMDILTYEYPEITKIIDKIGVIEEGIKDIEIARKKISGLVEEIEAFNDLAKLPADLENSRKQFTAVQKEIDDLNDAIDTQLADYQMRKELEKKRAELNKLNKVLEELLDERDFLGEVLENLYQELIAIMKDLITISESYPATEEKLRAIETDIEELEEQFAYYNQLKKLRLELEVDFKKIEAIANNLPDLEGACIEQTALT